MIMNGKERIYTETQVKVAFLETCKDAVASASDEGMLIGVAGDHFEDDKKVFPRENIEDVIDWFLHPKYDVQPRDIDELNRPVLGWR